MRGAVAAVALLGVLVACDDAPEPKVEGEPTPSGTPTSASPTTAQPTPTPTGLAEPELPTAAGENSDAGAEAFVRWWVELVNYAGATGDTRTLAARSDPVCDGCLGLIDLIDTTYAGGGHIEGGDWSIGRLTDLPLDHGADWAGFANARAQPQKIVSGDGTSKGYNGGKFYFYAYVAWSSDAWTMRWLRTPDPK